jgi:hypothetical protein
MGNVWQCANLRTSGSKVSAGVRNAPRLSGSAFVSVVLSVSLLPCLTLRACIYSTSSSFSTRDDAREPDTLEQRRPSKF